MKPQTYYGLRCDKKDEKVLMHRVNAYLATLDRKTSKAKNADLLKAFRPRVLAYFYWNLNKAAGTFVSIHPNEDARGTCFFPDRPDCGWLVKVRVDTKTWREATPKKAKQFVAGLVAATGFETVVLHEDDSL